MSSDGSKNRFAAKLMFAYCVESAAVDGFKICEERIVLLFAPSLKQALEKAKNRGKKAEFSYVNDDGECVQFVFVGVMDLMELGVECESDEVWYEVRKRKNPLGRRDKFISRT